MSETTGNFEKPKHASSNATPRKVSDEIYPDRGEASKHTTPQSDCAIDFSRNPIGVIGLGLMGSHIAQRLGNQNLAVIGFNRSPKILDGIEVASDFPSFAKRCTLFWIMVSDGEATEAMIDALIDLDITDKIIINAATIAPDHSEILAEKVRQAGGYYLEVPVLGSVPQVKTGTLQLLIGGDRKIIDRCQPVLDALGTITHFGPVRAGMAAKLAYNQLIGSLTAAFSMSLSLAQREGVDIDTFMATLRESALYAPTFDKKLANMLQHKYDQANFPLKHLLKDIRLFTKCADDQQIDTHPLIGLQHVLEESIYQGHAEHDYSALHDNIYHRAH